MPSLLAVLAVAAFLLKIAIALSTYGSTDVLIFEANLAKIEEEGGAALYRHGISTKWCGQTGQRACPPFNHPPFMIHALEGWGALTLLSGLPLRFWLRFTCAAADLGSLALLTDLLGRSRRNSRTRVALALFAASPIAILVSGFHGNADPIMIFFVLLSIWLTSGARIHRRPDCRDRASAGARTQRASPARYYGIHDTGRCGTAYLREAGVAQRQSN